MGGTKGGIEQVSGLSPEQQQLFTRLSQEFDPAQLVDMFQTSVGDPARQQFQQQTLPGIQERFIAGGGARSGAVGRAGVQAGADLETGLSGQLAQLIAGAQEGSLNRQAGLATSPIMNTFQRPSDSPLGNLLGPLAGGIGTAAGGPLGGAAASGLTQMFQAKQK